MSLIIDNQTLDDLNIFGKRNNDSIYAIFNRTHTRGGAEILEQLFRYPLSDAPSINQRSSIIRYFRDKKTAFPFKGDLFDAAEQYLADTDERSRLSYDENNLRRKFDHLIGADSEYLQVFKGITAIIEILIRLKVFLQDVTMSGGSPYDGDIREFRELMNIPVTDTALSETLPVKLNYVRAVEYDKMLRYVYRDRIKKILYHIYYLDVYISVAAVATQRGFTFPEAMEGDVHIMKLDGVYHPKLSKPVPNKLYMEPDSNIVFLTGANMAGKSTFMKSLGIALFLAHAGFPVPAEKMVFSVCDGLLTTINLPDDLNMGYSHFYTEVLRVKKMAVQLSKSKNLFIIFDELFRGTNVKDAYEATVAITAAFAGKPNCMFVVSTHIIEAGQTLADRCKNISFVYLPTRMEGDKPVYTHRLERGISADRHGMVIINNEGILDILREGKKQVGL
ncbi:MutS-related protein [Flavitalea flava]